MTFTVAPVAKSPDRQPAPTVILTVVAALGLALLSTSVFGKTIALAAVGVMLYRWPVHRILLAYALLTLAADERSNRPYNELWHSPVQHAADFWFETVKSSVTFLPVRASPMWLVALGLLVRTAARRTAPNCRRDRKQRTIGRGFGSAVTVAVGVVVVGALFGIATGGDVQQSYYQMFGLLVALSLAASTAAIGSPHFGVRLCNVVLAVALYRAALAAWVYLLVLRPDQRSSNLYVTSHGDSVLWSVALTILFARLMSAPTRRRLLQSLLAALPMVAAMVFNNRRLAWVMVAVSLGCTIWSARGSVRRRLLKLAPYAVPPISFYMLAAILGPPKRIFSPVQSLFSVAQSSDNSSLTRDIENFNLIYTLKSNLPIGSGFGHQYVELIRAYDITEGVGSTFVNYRYLPHNSVLGLLQWIGPIGFALALLPFVIGVHEAMQFHRERIESHDQTLAPAIVAAWVAYVLQSWGDQGLFSGPPVVLVGMFTGLGVALMADQVPKSP